MELTGLVVFLLAAGAQILVCLRGHQKIRLKIKIDLRYDACLFKK